MKTYIPLHVHSHYSLLDGLSKPQDIVDRCIEIDTQACAITDHGSISGHIQFLQKMEKAGKKPLLGCELYVSNEDAAIKNDRNRKLAHLCTIARNDDGWKDLISMVSLSNTKDLFYHKPRLDLDRIKQFGHNRNLIAFSGHIGSHMSNILFDESGNLSSSWRQNGVNLAYHLRDIFGNDNFFLEVQLMDSQLFPKQKLIADCIRTISKDTGIKCVASQDAHYAKQSDAEYQRILLCSNMRTTIELASKPEFGLSGFFRSKQYHIPSYDEMMQWHTEEELENTILLASFVDKYKNIIKSPILPKFNCPDGMSPDTYLEKLCNDGWAKKLKNIDEAKYRNRLNYELTVLRSAGLSSYFLIVADIINYVKSNGWLPGPGRGSCAGSLVSYLVGITSIDPIPYDLLFERFYNAGRNTADHISMPDIDLDVPKWARELVISYIKNKYGIENVGQMVSFQTMKGRGAIKDVLRAYGDLSNDEMNAITKNIIEEHKISDELQKMKEERGESSIIMWCLENTPNKLKDWCFLDDDGNMKGPLADKFEKAIRLEGVKTNMSKHPAGIIIAPGALSNMCPMIYDKETEGAIAGFEMADLEAIGGIKFDILGITALDKAMGVSQDLEYGEVHEISINSN